MVGGDNPITIRNELLAAFEPYDVECEVANANQLSRIMTDLDRAQNTIVIMTQDIMPDTVWNGLENSQVEKWMRAGGILVWTGDYELYYVGQSNRRDYHTYSCLTSIFGKGITAMVDGVIITEFDETAIPSMEPFVSDRPCSESKLTGIEYEAYGTGYYEGEELYDPIIIYVGEGAHKNCHE